MNDYREVYVEWERDKKIKQTPVKQEEVKHTQTVTNGFWNWVKNNGGIRIF